MLKKRGNTYMISVNLYEDDLRELIALHKRDTPTQKTKWLSPLCRDLIVEGTTRRLAEKKA